MNERRERRATGLARPARGPGYWHRAWKRRCLGAIIRPTL